MLGLNLRQATYTPLFLCKTKFHFPLFHCYVISLINGINEISSLAIFQLTAFSTASDVKVFLFLFFFFLASCLAALSVPRRIQRPRRVQAIRRISHWPRATKVCGKYLVPEIKYLEDCDLKRTTRKSLVTASLCYQCVIICDEVGRGEGEEIISFFHGGRKL